ncbi:hypothetical protein QE152_g10459 [Popillia japonica]|uniref:Uncharacterized protein n=1 Tax=Popillia japonica TaxID=7064 RepID=A0AAW1LUJ3_POPJA
MFGVFLVLFEDNMHSTTFLPAIKLNLMNPLRWRLKHNFSTGYKTKSNEPTKVEVETWIIIGRYNVDNTDYTPFTVFIMATGIDDSKTATLSAIRTRTL